MQRAGPSRPSSSQATTGSTEEVHKLIQHVARSFFETKQIVVLDQMVRGELAIRDENLATKLGVNLRDLSKILHPLLQQRLLAVYRRNELKEGAQKAVPKTWYYLDLKTFIDVVKWRMYKVRKTIDDKLRNEVKSQGYDCPKCKKTFSTLDVGDLVLEPQGFRCDICNEFLIDNESAAEAELGKTKIRRLLDQCSHILNGLKKTESIVLPSFDVKRWLDLNHPVADSATVKKDTDGLKIAQGGAKANVVKVEMADDEDALALQAKMEAEAEARRSQNALPSWIAKSTVSGALTEAGAKEAHAESLAQQEAAHRSALGLGTASDGDSALRAYYAKLQEQTASSRAVSESPSDDLADSLFEGVSPGAATATPPSSLGYNCEEERVTVNGNGKRSRQSSTAPITIELETTGEQPFKKVKVEGRESPTWLQPSASSVSVAAPPAEDSEDEGDFEEVA